jgi:hypothetical protein
MTPAEWTVAPGAASTLWMSLDLVAEMIVDHDDMPNSCEGSLERLLLL